MALCKSLCCISIIIMEMIYFRERSDANFGSIWGAELDFAQLVAWRVIHLIISHLPLDCHQLNTSNDPRNSVENSNAPPTKVAHKHLVRQGWWQPWRGIRTSR